MAPRGRVLAGAGEALEPRKNRKPVAGLRRSDPTTLLVLIQDVIGLPLGQIHPQTLVDLLALSEVPEQLPTALARDLNAFRDRMFGAISDLPDGPPLAEFARELCAVPAKDAPSLLRTHIAQIVGERRHLDAIAAVEDLIEHWTSEDPSDLVVPGESETRGPRVVPPRQIIAPVREPRERKATATPVSMVDDRREGWVREDVMSRLANYGSRGLKEPVIVAGSRHRAPWNDMSEAEVLTVLRKMKREGIVRYSAGRWMVNR